METQILCGHGAAFSVLFVRFLCWEESEDLKWKNLLSVGARVQ